VLPSCLTEMVWEMRADPVTEVDRRWSADYSVAIDPVAAPGGELCLDARVERADPVPPAWDVVAASMPGSGRWTLQPRTAADEGAALLACTEAFAVDTATVTVNRSASYGRLASSLARLDLGGAVRTDAIASPLDASALPPATAQALAALPRPDLEDAARGARVPLRRQCELRLWHCDLRSMLPPPAADLPCEIEAVVWTDAALELLHAGAPLDAPALAESDGELASRLDALSRARLVVQLVSLRGRFVVALRPDFVWLLAGVEARPGGRFAHVSTWRAVPGAAAKAAEHGPPRSACIGRMRVDVCEWRLATDDRLLEKILLTPFAFAADFAMSVLAGRILRAAEPEPADHDPARASRRN
jgi:hypothetical protein